MKVKMILPALIEANTPLFRPIKYSLFPPLGLATLAAFLDGDDEVSICDEHVERLDLSDSPDLVVIQVYITSAYRSYRIARHYRSRGVYVVLGGLHVTSCPDEARQYADSIFLGPGEDAWPEFLEDFRGGAPKCEYASRIRTLEQMPPIRRDLIKRHLYLVPNSIVVSRGCPNTCDFCYKESFFRGGRSYYSQSVESVLCEIERLPGRHLYFLDDHLFANPGFAGALFEGMRGMRRIWQAAGTVGSVLIPDLLEKAAVSGLRSLFVGFETQNQANLHQVHKRQNVRNDYSRAVRRLHDLGIMANGSFVFGLDEDEESVFDRTVSWAIGEGMETATFHILTPYPGTRLYESMKRQGRVLHHNWDLYDTRHCVFRPRKLSPNQLEAGYRRAYKEFYRWRSVFRSASTKDLLHARLRHLAYAAGWKKCEPIWDAVIRAGRVSKMLPLLERILDGRAYNRENISIKSSAPFENFLSVDVENNSTSAIMGPLRSDQQSI